MALPAPHRALRPRGVRDRVSAEILITGAAGGIGSAAIAELRARGATVVGLDLAPAPTSPATSATRRRSTRAVAAAIERLGRPRRPDQQRRHRHPQSAGAAPDADALRGARRQPDRALARHRPPRCPRCAPRAGAWSTSPPASPTSPSRSRPPTAEQARPGRLLGRAAPRVRRRDHGHDRLPRLHPHGDPRALDAQRRAAGGRGAGRAGRGRRAGARPRRARPPVRDLATTRQGEIGYSSPARARALLDRITPARMQRLARRGHFDASGIAGEYAARARA